MLPKNPKKLEKEYKRCQKKFVNIPKENYHAYFEEAYSDLDSASKEENDKWAITKAYQTLFLYCNGLLVKKIGFYSKDNMCVIIALLKNNIVSEKILEKIQEMLKTKKKVSTEIELKSSFFEEISKIRITRNKYLYLPRIQRKLKESPKQRVTEVKEIIKILSEIE